MIAVDIPGTGDRVAERLRTSLGLGATDIFALGPDDTDCRGAEVLIFIDTDRERFEKVLDPGVKWVHSLSTGVDHVPLDLIGERHLTCSRGANAIPIAEFVLASMLAFEKKMPEVWITSADEWRYLSLGGLEGKTLGLIGLGVIGIETAKRALAFDMEVLAYRRTGAPSAVPGIAVVSDLVEVLSAADHLVVAAPATAQTRHIVGTAAFEAMKQGVHLINISRGSLVDQDALIDAIESGKISRATLDVTDPEPLPEGHPLYSHPNVRISAHTSWSAPTSIGRSIELFEENVRLYLSGRPLVGIVDVEAGY
ncbi:MAG: NAD(P)-dependent oxidoreductase [Acidimicrobiales bacterium]